MKKHKSLVTVQEETAAEILALSENGKRAMGYGLSFLNKRSRGLARIRRAYIKYARSVGFSERQAECQWEDIKDHVRLQNNAD